MKPKAIRIPLIAAATATPLSAFAHDGHGNTPLHAIMHMLEQNGAAIGLLLLVAVGSLIWRAQQKRSQNKTSTRKQEVGRDSR
mgnify:CR=1 FL=1